MGGKDYRQGFRVMNVVHEAKPLLVVLSEVYQDEWCVLSKSGNISAEGALL